MVVVRRLTKLSENNKSNNKKNSVFVIAGVAGFLAIIAFTGIIGQEAETRVVDAQSSNKELQDQITVLQNQMNATISILQSHENALIQHQELLQQHDIQIQSITNNTNIIGNWASEFSNNINDRVTTLEGEQ